MNLIDRIKALFEAEEEDKQTFAEVEIDGVKVRYESLEVGAEISVVVVNEESGEEEIKPIPDGDYEIEGKMIKTVDGKIEEVSEVETEEEPTGEEPTEEGMSLHEEYERRFSKIEAQVQSFENTFSELLTKLESMNFNKVEKFDDKEIQERITKLQEEISKQKEDLEKLSNEDSKESFAKVNIQPEKKSPYQKWAELH